MKLNVLAQDDRVVQLACEGTLTPLPSQLRGDALDGVLGPARPGRSVLLDLSQTDYINSLGINWLIQVHKRLTKLGGTLVLCGLTPPVQASLHLVQLLSVLRVAVDRAAGLAVLARQAHGA